MRTLVLLSSPVDSSASSADSASSRKVTSSQGAQAQRVSLLSLPVSLASGQRWHGGEGPTSLLPVFPGHRYLCSSGPLFFLAVAPLTCKPIAQSGPVEMRGQRASFFSPLHTSIDSVSCDGKAANHKLFTSFLILRSSRAMPADCHVTHSSQFFRSARTIAASCLILPLLAQCYVP